MNQKNLRLGIAAAVILAIVFGIWKYRQPRFSGGDKASDFTVKLINGNEARLSDLKGKYVLLQFWGSWCGPCRQENLYLYELYKKYHERGFEIFSVGLETQERYWRNAIQVDRLIWPYHTMESASFDGPVAKLYNIKSIPATFLLNPDGVIMGVNLAPDYLNKMLSEKL